MPKFLQDKPTEDDVLGGTHEKITESLKTIINSLNINKSIKNIIGLFGDWGSGKSSIIKQLDKEEKYVVFEFDSWSHKDEFLKRAFLIELTKKLNFFEKNLNIGDDLSKYKDFKIGEILNNNIKKQFIKNNREIDINAFTLTIFFITILSILGFNFFEFSSKIYENYFKDVLYYFYELIFSLIPNNLFTFIFSILFIISVLIFCYKRNYFQIIIRYFKEEIKKVINFLILKDVDFSENKIESEGLDFTNFDYQNLFKSIIKSYLIENPSNKLIIVLDNLDRVDDEIVLNSISLIQTTIEGIKLEDETIFSKLFFILPIDKKRLKEVFEKLIKLDDNEKDKIKDNFTEGFIDKTFSVIMDIPSLEQSDWREFFKNKLFEAFKENNEESISDCFNRLGGVNIIDNLVISFYSLVRNNNKKITPREIINFINELVSNYIYWNNLIEFEKQGEYILYKRYKFINDEIFQKWLKESGKYNEEIVKQIFKTDDISDILFLNDCIIYLKEGNLDKFYDNFDKVKNSSNKNKLLDNSFDSILGDKEVGINIIGNMINVIFDSEKIPNTYKNKLKDWLNDEFGFFPEFTKNIDIKSSKGVLKMLDKHPDLNYLKSGLSKSMIKNIILSNKPQN